MAYTNFTTVQSDFKDITFDSTSNITSSDVTQFIVEADALINSYLATKYSTPVSGTSEGLELLKLLSRSLVAGRIKRILEVKQEKNTDANQNIIGVLLTPTAVMKILEALQNGNQVLVGVDPVSSAAGFYSNNVAEGIEPVFKKDCKQW